jgi:parallel beta-helix repeat protein
MGPQILFNNLTISILGERRLQIRIFPGITFILLLLTSLLATIASVQLPASERPKDNKSGAKGNIWARTDWNKRLGGLGLDTAKCLFQNGDGGHIFAGHTDSYSVGYWDFVLTEFMSATIYIRYDGSVEPSNAPIQRNGDIYTLTDNIHTNATMGIMIERDNVILDGAGYTIQGIGNYTGIYLSERNNVTIKNMGIDAFVLGVYAYSCSNTTLSENDITDNQAGMFLYFGSNNTIAENNMANNLYIGLWTAYSSDNSISGNNITLNGQGIELYSSSNNNIISGNNVATNEGAGIALDFSCENNTIVGNSATSNYDGIVLYSSTDNAVVGNDVTNSEGGISLQDSISNVISGNNIANNTYGIDLWNSSSSIIYGNNITTNHDYGIYVSESSYGTIARNDIAESEMCGIDFYLSSYINVSGNNITNDHLGIYFFFSSNNSITGNNIAANNQYGIYLYSSSNNTMYHNSVENNANQVCSINSSNAWDDGYPSGGNYWSDYHGTDLHRGNYQNITGGDGIGDTPYIIDANNTDNFPLMGTFGSPTAEGENVTVFPTEDVGLTFETVTAAGSTTVNTTATGPEPPLGFEFAGQYYNIQTTASYTGQIDVRIIYDDSGMTQVTENALRLRQWNTTQWIDITTYVDTINNVIYGVASHLSMFGVTSIMPLPEGIAVVDSACSKTVIGQGYDLTINVTVRNQGASTQTFDLFIYADAAIIRTQTISNLPPSEQVAVAFAWNTSGSAKGIHVISVSNQLVSLVTVTIPGDVDGTFEVDIYDVTAICVCYNSKIGPPPDPLYYPNCDLDGNGVIDIFDVVTACITYGQKYP